MDGKERFIISLVFNGKINEENKYRVKDTNDDSYLNKDQIKNYLEKISNESLIKITDYNQYIGTLSDDGSATGDVGGKGLIRLFVENFNEADKLGII
ncbi:hypothetical protein [Weissella paramesenteroides]|uniref:hypothetical protein n=1 Tax=Weissella paramesenteroides TaxID=1249 RepID=UPI00223B18A8|nr:hypothetical protein [Weissella paramesenteroides]MCT0486349.1 hypothetical protein [Weissella paramesenteroides]MDF8366184.1 hypothetical protein [Weissella paramesenteroides]